QDLHVTAALGRGDRRIHIRVAEAQELQDEIAEAAARDVDGRRAVAVIHPLRWHEQTRADREGAVAPRLDEEHFDQDLERPVVQLAYRLHEHVVIVLRGPDEQRVRQLIVHTDDGTGQGRPSDGRTDGR